MDIFNKIKLILLKPNEFFLNLKEEGIKEAFWFFVVLSVFYSIVSSALLIGLSSVFNLNAYLSGLNVTGISSKYLTMFFTTPSIIKLSLLGLISGVLFSFVIGLGLFFWLQVFKGKEGYAKAYQLYVYSTTPSLVFGWIPFVKFFAGAYAIFLLILGTKNIYNFSMTKSVLMYVAPLVVIYLLSLVLMGVVFFSLLSPF